MRCILAIISILFLPAVAMAGVKIVATVGVTYSISEQDALVEIEERAKAVDWSKTIPKSGDLAAYQPSTMLRLPKAQKGKRYLIDLTFTLKQDLPDGRGGILYPKGYTFNPLDIVPFDQVLVIIDGDDREQIAWLFTSPLLANPKTRIMVTDGESRDLAAKLNHPVTYADSRIISRFRVGAVPAIIQAQGKLILVEEVKVASSH